MLSQAALAIWKGYAYIYYRIYTANLRVAGKSDLPQWNAMFGVAFLSFVNLLTITLAISALIGWTYAFHAKSYEIIGFAISWALINYIFLLRNGKYKKIAEKYSRENKSRRRRNLIFCWLYVLLTFAAAITCGLFA